MSAKREVWAVFASVEGNNNKFYHLIQDGCTVTSNWGRVGDSPQSTTWTYSSEITAEKEFNKKIKEKKRKGYEVVDTGAGTPSVLNKSSLSEIALRDIGGAASCETTKNLIKYLSDVNVHSILEKTSFSYNSTTGAFTTPLGVLVSQNTINQARSVLATIKKTSDIGELASLTNKYLRLIPQNLGRARDKLNLSKIWELRSNGTPSDFSLLKQTDILDSLEASLTAPTEPGIIEQESQRVFNCTLNLVEDQNIISHINKLFESTRQTIHTTYYCKLKRVYSVDLPSKFSEYAGKINNVMKLWHGSRSSNCLSILKNGLVIPPENASYVCGRNYANGVYFSDQSTKALQYSNGTWSGNYTKEDTIFAFLAEVCMGKYYVPTSTYDRPLPRPGYDSTFAVGGKSGVINNEMVVYNTDQVKLTYLCEFTK